MPVGLGARTSNIDTRYFVAAQQQDNYVSGGVSSGKTVVKFPGFGGAAENGTGLDGTAIAVWVITGVSIAIVLGIHASFGGHRLL